VQGCRGFPAGNAINAGIRLDASRCGTYNLCPDLEAKLARLAADRGSDAGMLAQEANECLVDCDDWFLREVEKGTAAADRGELITMRRSAS
jgi:predicted transcriptional regulator